MRRFIRAVVAVAIAVAFLSAAVTTAHAEDDNPLLTVHLGLNTAETLGGVIEVPLAITAEAGVSPRTASVRITGQYSPERSRSANIELPAECATRCDVIVPIDTLTWYDPGDDPAAVDTLLDEGYLHHWVEATVTAQNDVDTSQVTATETRSVRIYNARPYVWPPSVSHEPVRSDGTTNVSFTIEAPPDGQVIDRVQVTLLGHGRRVDASFPPSAPDAYGRRYMTVPVSVTGLPEGLYTVRVFAFDTAGTASLMRTGEVPVYHGPRVRVLALAGQNPPTEIGNEGFDTGVATLQFSTGPGWWGYQPQLLKVFLDNHEYPVATVKYFPESCLDVPCVDTVGWTTIRVPLSIPYGEVLPPGPHKLRIVYSEITERWGTTPTVTSTSDATHTVTASGVAVKFKVLGPVAEGTGGTLQATMTGVVGTGGQKQPTVVSWRAVETYPGAPTLASGVCTSACTSTTVSIPLKSLLGGYPGIEPSWRWHTVGLHVKDSTGVTRVSYVEVNVDARAVVTIGTVAKTAKYGAKVRVPVGVQQGDGAMLPGVAVTLQARIGGTTAWRTVATGKTNSNGQFVAYPVVTHNTTWRAVVAQRPGYHGPGTSRLVATTVPARVTLSGVPTAPVRGKAYRVTAAVAPTGSGRLVYIQTKVGTTAWRTVAKPTTDRYGVARANVTFGRGTTYVRAIAVAIPASAAGASNTTKAVAR